MALSRRKPERAQPAREAEDLIVKISITYCGQ